MKRILTVIALSAALGLSTMGFRSAGAETDCDATSDLSVTADLNTEEVGMGEVKGSVVNHSDRDYDEVLVLVEFHGPAATSDTDLDIDIDRERQLDIDGDLDVEDGDIDADIDADIETNGVEVTVEGEDSSSGSSVSSSSLGTQVFTLTEDLEAGEAEEFELDITPPAGTTSITTRVVCAD
jgi:hypothetical protein